MEPAAEASGVWHLARDTATSDIRAVKFTPRGDDPCHGLQANHCRAVDSPVLPDLLEQKPDNEQIGTSRQIALQSPYGQWTAPTIAAGATRLSSSAMPRPPLRSGETDDCGRRTALQPRPATSYCVPQSALLQSILETMEWLPHTKSYRSPDAMPQAVRRAYHGAGVQFGRPLIRVALKNQFPTFGTAGITCVKKSNWEKS